MVDAERRLKRRISSGARRNIFPIFTSVIGGHLNREGGLKMGILLILEILAEIIAPPLTVEDKVT
jgi:hypothetical protein